MTESVDRADTADGANLAAGLARNTLFNFAGWVALALLAVVAVPFTVSRLGIAAYGVFSIVSVVTGYLGALHTPATEGGVRFMAEAHGREDWAALRQAAIATATLAAGVASLGAVIMLAAAPILVSVFKVPAELADQSTAAFRLGALALPCSAVSNSLSGALAATRRFGTLNLVAIVTRTLTTAAILTAVALGGGLVGAVRAQVFAGILTVLVYGVCVALTFRGLTTEIPRASEPTPWRRFASFSGLLLLSNLASVLGLQLDRAVVGSILGAAAVGFYTIPARLTDYLISLIGSLTEALYPLSSNAAATSRLDQLRSLYVRAARLLTWLAAVGASLLIVPAADILRLWVGPEIATRAWPVLACLAATAIWRSPASIAYRVCNGLGRADLTLRIAWASLASVLCLIVPLTRAYGITGTALAVLLAQIPVVTTYDLLVQRKLLGQRDWSVSVGIYLKPSAVTLVACLIGAALSLEPGWVSLGVRVAVVLACFALGVAVLDPAVTRDLRALATRLLRARSPLTAG